VRNLLISFSFSFTDFIAFFNSFSFISFNDYVVFKSYLFYPT
jgi:hypothetical protein